MSAISVNLPKEIFEIHECGSSDLRFSRYFYITNYSALSVAYSVTVRAPVVRGGPCGIFASECEEGLPLPCCSAWSINTISRAEPWHR